MSNDAVVWYLEAIQRELYQLVESKFTGNIKVQLNFKEGGIANMNLDLSKSMRKPTITKDG